MKIERLLAITIMLLNRRRATALQLAEHFAVSPRTIYRDIDTLNRAGIPIISNQGFEGGFSIPANYKLSRQLLTYDDMVSIITALKGINASLQNRGIDTVIEKITSLIPADKQELYEKQRNSFIIDISPWGGPFHLKETLALIQRGIAESRLLHFHYIDAQGAKTKRKVEPHALVFKSFNWYLLAFCTLRRSFRVFRLIRIKGPSLQPYFFIRREVDVLSHFQPESDARKPVELILRITARVYIRMQEMFDETAVEHLEDGRIEVRVTYPDDDWIYSFILSFGDEIEVVSPIILRRKIEEKIKKMHKLYRNMT